MAQASSGVGDSGDGMACTELRTLCELARGASCLKEACVLGSRSHMSGSGSHKALALGAGIGRLKEPLVCELPCHCRRLTPKCYLTLYQLTVLVIPGGRVGEL